MSSPRNDKSIQSTNKILTWLKDQQQKFNSPRDIIIPTAIQATIMNIGALATSFFLDKENVRAYNHPLTLSTTFTLLSAILRSPKISGERRRKGMQIVYSLIFSINEVLTKLALTHESGHVLACFALVKKAQPIIKIMPEFGFNKTGGYTSCNSTEFSDLYTALGETKSNVLFSTSGTGMNMLLATILLTVAEFLPIDYFETKCHLRLPAISIICHAIYYALSALWLCDSMPGHDFCNIKNKSGITPIESGAIIFAAGLAVQLVLSGTSYLRQKCNKKSVEYHELTDEQELAVIDEQHSVEETDDTAIDMPLDQSSIKMTV